MKNRKSENLWKYYFIFSVLFHSYYRNNLLIFFCCFIFIFIYYSMLIYFQADIEKGFVCKTKTRILYCYTFFVIQFVFFVVVLKKCETLCLLCGWVACSQRLMVDVFRLGFGTQNNLQSWVKIQFRAVGQVAGGRGEVGGREPTIFCQVVFFLYIEHISLLKNANLTIICSLRYVFR